MNIYARYFNQDALVSNFDELMEFLSSIPDVPINQRLIDDIHAYIDSDMPYPKRYKIRPRVYFILIKTAALTLEEFKANRRVEGTYHAGGPSEPIMNKKEFRTAQLSEVRKGWYYGSIVFKRVIQVAHTTKFRYQDTPFEAYVQAESGQDCYDQIISHLKNRSEVDLRSQFPSARGVKFKYIYIGESLPDCEN